MHKSVDCILINIRCSGRVDCIAEYDGILSIIDFKTSTSERKDSITRITIFKHLHMQRCLKRELDCDKSSCNFSCDRGWCRSRIYQRQN